MPQPNARPALYSESRSNVTMETIGRETLVTEEGYQKLKDELEYLTTTKREEVAERIKVAREYGDISENAEYDDAKNEQARVEARIVQVEERIRTAKIVTETDNKTVGIGNKVTVENKKTGDEEVYWIAGSSEADPLANRVSNESPVGKGLFGRKKGDTVDIAVPAGKLKYEIKKIAKG
jgi:transcription elongation factor GreA